MSNRLTGVIAVIKETNQVSEKFSKREFVVNTSEQYPQSIPLQFTNAKCSALNSYKVGDTVSVDYNLKGREWTNPEKREVKYFITLEAWKIEYVASGQHQDAPSQNVPQNVPSNPIVPKSDELFEDLPF